MIQILNAKANMNQVVKISTALELQESIVAFLHLKVYLRDPRSLGSTCCRQILHLGSRAAEQQPPSTPRSEPYIFPESRSGLSRFWGRCGLLFRIADW